MLLKVEDWEGFVEEVSLELSLAGCIHQVGEERRAVQTERAESWTCGMDETEQIYLTATS